MAHTKISDIMKSCNHAAINPLTKHCRGCGMSLVEIDKLREKKPKA